MKLEVALRLQGDAEKVPSTKFTALLHTADPWPALLCKQNQAVGTGTHHMLGLHPVGLQACVEEPSLQENISSV